MSINRLAALLPAIVTAAAALPSTPAVLAGHPWVGGTPAAVTADGYPWVGSPPATTDGHPWAGTVLADGYPWIGVAPAGAPTGPQG